MSRDSKAGLVAIVLGTLAVGIGGAQGQGSKWPEADAAVVAPAPRTPADASPARTAPPPQAEPVAPAGEPSATSASRGAGAPYLYWPEVEGVLRYLVYTGIFLVSYLVPLVLFLFLLSRRRWHFDPGQTTAICLAAGGLLFGAPALLSLLAREHFANGLPVPWYRQSEQYAWIGAWAAAFVVIAIIAWRTKVATQGDWS